jgi:maltose/moltooligosaccharide transporter
MAAGLLGLRCGNNTAMEPYRAFIADTLKPAQQPTGFQAQSFFTGFGQTLANVSFSVLSLLVQLGYNLGFSFFSVGLFHRICLVLILPEEELKKIKEEPLTHHLLIYFRQLKTCQK